MTDPHRPTVRPIAPGARRRPAWARWLVAAAVGAGVTGMLVLVPGWLHGPWEAASRIGAATPAGGPGWTAVAADASAAARPKTG